MILFNTERLIIKCLENKDKSHFAKLFTETKILELIPQEPYTEKQITERFNNNLNVTVNDLDHKKCALGIYENNQTELIGLALFLIDDNGDKELDYRFRVNYWGNGYGTELTRGMLDYYFNQMNTNKVTADVNIANIGSVKILDKFMQPIDEFFNPRDQCTDRRYEIKKSDWIKQRTK